MPVLIEVPWVSAALRGGTHVGGSGGTDFFGRQKAIIFNIRDVFIYIPVFHPSPLMGVFPFSVLLDTPVTVPIRAVFCD